MEKLEDGLKLKHNLTLNDISTLKLSDIEINKNISQLNTTVTEKHDYTVKEIDQLKTIISNQGKTLWKSEANTGNIFYVKGNVGIGTTGPEELLHIDQGNLKVSDGSVF